MTKIRIAGAQLPVNDYSILYNLNEIKKALDWAAENDVDVLQTPEASLSGYDSKHWLYRQTEKSQDDILLNDALKEVEDYQKKLGVGLNLGTCILSQEFGGNFARNQIRYYNKEGAIYFTTEKTCLVGADEPVISSFFPLEVFQLPMIGGIGGRCVGMICNDMWSFTPNMPHNTIAKQSLIEKIVDEQPDIIFHATNGYKFNPYTLEKAGENLVSIRDNVYEPWHDGWLKFTAFSGISHILTVETCTEWDWDGDENTVDKFKTASVSGVLNPLGQWEVQAPRYGRQYFYYDYDTNSTHKYHTIIHHENNGSLVNVIPAAGNSLMKQFETLTNHEHRYENK
tara:strand:+ start:665 stop:1684 length:1020 start_codon:yes stop_codon:yes gene_type:complete